MPRYNQRDMAVGHGEQRDPGILCHRARWYHGSGKQMLRQYVAVSQDAFSIKILYVQEVVTHLI